VSFVAHDATFGVYVLRAADFDAKAEQALARAARQVQENAALLLADAEIYFYGWRDKGVVETDPSTELARWKGADFPGRAMLERFAQEVGASPAAGS